MDANKIDGIVENEGSGDPRGGSREPGIVE